jgi:hypothetical protein
VHTCWTAATLCERYSCVSCVSNVAPVLRDAVIVAHTITATAARTDSEGRIQFMQEQHTRALSQLLGEIHRLKVRTSLTSQSSALLSPTCPKPLRPSPWPLRLTSGQRGQSLPVATEAVPWPLRPAPSHFGRPLGHSCHLSGRSSQPFGHRGADGPHQLNHLCCEKVPQLRATVCSLPTLSSF